MSRINKLEYKKARRLYRENGRYSLRWMSEEARAVFGQLESGKDHLAERASIILGNGIDCISDHSFAQHRADDFEAVMETYVDPFVESLEVTQ